MGNYKYLEIKIEKRIVDKKTNGLSIVMLGASGAVGTETLNTLIHSKKVQRLTLLGRTPIPNISSEFVHQHKINIHESNSYQAYLQGHNIAICTLGVGQPSKMSKEEFVKIDKTAVINFATACKNIGVEHFQLLSSVGTNPESGSFYLRMKGELIEELKKLNFERLSIFQPSMILTKTNRYGMGQAITLKVWPILKPILVGGLRKYRGVPVQILGQAIANNILEKGQPFEILQWNEFYALKTR